MATTFEPRSADLTEHGLEPSGTVHWNPTTSQLYTDAILRGDGKLAEGGPLMVDTGEHTGRSPQDRFIVREQSSEERINWGKVNQAMEEEQFDGLREKVVAHLEANDLYVVNAFAGADPEHRLPLRVITDSPWHALFAKTLFIEPTEEELEDHHPDALVLHAPSVEADPDADGTNSGTFVVLHPGRGEVIVGGTFYAGEIKKSIFSLLNDRLPLEGVLPMHCSANVDDEGQVALFFGLSGTGKTTLSADPERHLIGDDEHGWSDEGVFNFEGGCYAKVINLSAEAEPQIFRTTHTFGTVLENVVADEGGRLDLPTTRRPRTHAPPTSSSRSTTRFPRSAPDIPPTSSSSRRTRSGSCRRSRDSHATRRCTTSSPATRPSLLGQRSAWTSRSRRSPPASARPSCRSRPPCTRRCSGTSSRSTARACGWSTPAGRAGRSARGGECRSGRPARCCGPR